jgi:hypothetical protein
MEQINIYFAGQALRPLEVTHLEHSKEPISRKADSIIGIIVDQ